MFKNLQSRNIHYQEERDPMFVIDFDIETNKSYTIEALSQGHNTWLRSNQSKALNFQECPACSKTVERRKTSLSSS